MTRFRFTYCFLIVALLLMNIYFQGWSDGYDLGHLQGYHEAILSGEVQVECNFSRNCEKSYKEGLSDGIKSLIEIKCGNVEGGSDEPDSFTL